MKLKFIVCLGNPGREYNNTPHNVGYDVGDILAGDSRFVKNKNLYLAAKRKNDGVVVVKPLTFMNLSGAAIVSLTGAGGVEPGGILVVCDDFALPLGKIRWRPGGSDGGHKGLRSIISEVGEDFPRLRIGVGPVPGGVQPSEFVLTPFKGENLKRKNLVVRDAAKIIEGFLSSPNFYSGDRKSGTWEVDFTYKGR